MVWSGLGTEGVKKAANGSTRNYHKLDEDINKCNNVKKGTRHNLSGSGLNIPLPVVRYHARISKSNTHNIATEQDTASLTRGNGIIH